MKLYLIPGFEETLNDPGYKQIIEAAEKKGYEPHFLDLQIKGNLISKLIEESVKIIEHNSVIIGFSNGALLAYLITTKLPFNKAIICSITDILGEDTKGIERELADMFTSKTAEEFPKIEYGKSLAKELYFFNGSEEKYITNRVNKLIDLNPESKQILVPETEHELNDSYVSKIVEVL